MPQMPVIRIPLRVQMKAGVDAIERVGEPVRFGVPLPAGAVRDVEGWILEQSARRSPVQARALDYWPDGSIRWMLVDTVWSGSPAAHAGDLVCGGESALSDRPRLAVTSSSPRVTVDTGVATVVFDAGGAFPFASVAAGRETRYGGQSGVRVTGDDGRPVDVHVTRLTVESTGPQRAVVFVEGACAGAALADLRCDARVELFAGLAAMRVQCTVRNERAARHPGNFWDLGDAGSLRLKDVSWHLSSATTLASWRVSLDRAMLLTAIDSPIELYQDSSGGENWASTNHWNRDRTVPASFRGYRLRHGGAVTTGLRATPILDAPPGLTVADPYFWQNCPTAIDAAPDGAVIHWFPGQYADLHELQGGEQKTREVFVSFGEDHVTPAAPLAWARSPALVSAAPEWIVASGAVDFLAPLEPRHASLVQTAIDGPDSFEAKREVVDEYGWRHFGDVYGDHEAIGHTGPTPLTSHYNNQYDPIAGFALQFMRTGDARWWHAMSELAAHVVDIDIYHTDRDKAAYSGGLFWHTYHYGDADTSTHRTYPKRNTGTVFGGGPSADHNYPTGLMLHYFLTGNEASKQAAVGLAAYVLRIDDGRLSHFRWLSRADTGNAHFTTPDFFGPARSSGNSLNAVVDGHRLTGDAAFIRKADQLVIRVVHPKDDLFRNRLDEPEYRWFYLMYLQSLGKYLTYKASLGQHDGAYAQGRASLLHYARWMAEHEYPYLDRPEKLDYPTETWAAQDIRKSDVFFFAAAHADPAERSRFFERGRFFHERSIDTLLESPTRALARPVIVLLTSGFLRVWAEAHAAFTLPAAEVPVPLAEPLRFVSQRTYAMKRAKLIAVGLAAVGIAMAAEIIRWLL